MLYPQIELRGAIEAGVMTTDDVYAELGELVNGTKAGRENDQELIVVDLTGTGAQDAAIGQVCRAVTIFCSNYFLPSTSHELANRSFVFS